MREEYDLHDLQKGVKLLHGDLLKVVASYLGNADLHSLIRALEQNSENTPSNTLITLVIDTEGNHTVHDFIMKRIAEQDELAPKLIWAVERGSHRDVEHLLSSGADPNLAGGRLSVSPLARIALLARCDLRIILALLKRGADPIPVLKMMHSRHSSMDDTEKKILMLFWIALQHNGKKSLNLHGGADWQSPLVDGVLYNSDAADFSSLVRGSGASKQQIQLSLKLAVLKGSRTLFALLNAVSDQERDGLFQEAAGFALKLGQPTLALELLEQNFPVNRRQLIQHAAVTCNPQLVRWLLGGYSENDPMPIHDFNLAVKSASSAGNPSVVSYLLDHQQSLVSNQALDSIDRRGIIFAAARNWHSDVLDLLHSHWGSDSQLFNSAIQHAFIEAVRFGETDVTKFILEKQTDYRNQLLRDGLISIVRNSNPYALQLLLTQVPQDFDLSDALVAAAGNGHHGVLELLLTRVPQDFDLSDALVAAAGNGHHGVLELLLTRVPQDFDLSYALSLAAQFRHLDIVTLLLKKGALRYNSGERALEYAVWQGNRAIVDELLAYGAYTPSFISDLKSELFSILIACTFLLPPIPVIGCMINPSLFFALCGITVIKAACYNFLISFLINVMGTIFLNDLHSRFDVGALFLIIGEIILLLSSMFIPPLLFVSTVIITGPADLLLLPIFFASAFIGWCAFFSALGVNDFISTCRRSSLSLHRTLLAACGFYKTKSPDEVPDSDHAAQPVPSV